jgi:hypothetical protein
MSKKDEVIQQLENRLRDQQAVLENHCSFCQDDKVPHDVSNSIWEEWLDQPTWEGSDTSAEFSCDLWEPGFSQIDLVPR